MATPTEGLVSLIIGLITGSRAAQGVRNRKSYIVSGLTIITGLYVLFTGEAPTFGNPVVMDPAAGLELILGGLGLGTLRAGVAKVQKANGSE